MPAAVRPGSTSFAGVGSTIGSRDSATPIAARLKLVHPLGRRACVGGMRPMTQEAQMSSKRGEKTDEPGIYRREDGSYLVRTSAKSPKDGKQVHRQKTMPKDATLAEAIEVREAIKSQIRNPEPPREERISTLSDYSELWLKQKARKLKPSTTNRYQHALGKRILPQLGHIPLERLSRQDILDWVHWASTVERTSDDGESARRYSTATVRGWWSVLCTLVRDAEADGLLDRDLTYRIDSPETDVRNVREQRTLSAEQLYELVEAARERYPTRYAEIAFLGYTGVRVGEAYALTWSDVDLGRGRAEIAKSVWRGEVVTTTKTGDPRVVPLPGLVVEALDQHHDRLMREQHPGFEAGLVFPSNDGNHRIPQSLQTNFEVLTSEEWLDLDIHVTPQVLRRSYNTILRKAKVDRIVLREMMGHADEKMTELYSSVDFDEKKAAITRVFDANQGTQSAGGAN